MALTVDYLYTFARDLILKNQAGGLKSTAFANHWNDAQSTYFDDLVGRFQMRNNGKENPNTGLIMNETTIQKLSPFIKLSTLTVTTGNADKPTDFVYRLAMRVNDHDAVKINQAQIAAVVNSVIDAPSIPNNLYYFTEYEDYYSFLPTTITEADLDYICVPNMVVWAYTIDGDGRQVYSAAGGVGVTPITGSVQPQWDDSSCREITKRMLTNLGVMFKDSDFANFGKSVQVTGE